MGTRSAPDAELNDMLLFRPSKVRKEGCFVGMRPQTANGKVPKRGDGSSPADMLPSCPIGRAGGTPMKPINSPALCRKDSGNDFSISPAPKIIGRGKRDCRRRSARTEMTSCSARNWTAFAAPAGFNLVSRFKPFRCISQICGKYNETMA